MSVLEVENLTVEYVTASGNIRAVEDVNFSVESGEIIGIVGESGSGKSTVAQAIQGILEDNARIVDGEIRYNGVNLLELDRGGLNDVRWNDISYIAQSAMNALDPIHRIKVQFWEVMRRHTDASKQESNELAEDLLDKVGLDAKRMYNYPFELSGGERQRAVIALSLALDPTLVIADEPTTGLDVVVQDEILDVIEDIQRDLQNSMLLITHDINVVAEIADKVIVMYAGQVVEEGTTQEVFKESGHPYTMGLRNAFPSLEKRDENLMSIPGTPPNLVSPPSGCRFQDRCPFARSECARDPPHAEVEDGHKARCHFTEEADEFRERAQNSELWKETKEVEET